MTPKQVPFAGEGCGIKLISEPWVSNMIFIESYGQGYSSPAEPQRTLGNCFYRKSENMAYLQPLPPHTTMWCEDVPVCASWVDGLTCSCRTGLWISQMTQCAPTTLCGWCASSGFGQPSLLLMWGWGFQTVRERRLVKILCEVKGTTSTHLLLHTCTKLGNYHNTSETGFFSRLWGEILLSPQSHYPTCSKINMCSNLRFVSVIVMPCQIHSFCQPTKNNRHI